MIKLTNRCMACLGLSLVVAVLSAGAANAGLFDWLKSRKPPPAPPRKSLVIFPFDPGVPGLPEDFGAEVASYLRSTLTGSDKYMVVVFRDKLAPIQRAKEDTTLKTSDWVPPFSEDKEKPLKLARLLAADYFLVGSIEDFRYDAAKKAAQMTLSAAMYDTRTGKLVAQYLVTGSVDESAKAGDESEYRAVAAGRAVEALKERILASSSVEEPDALGATASDSEPAASVEVTPAAAEK